MGKKRKSNKEKYDPLHTLRLQSLDPSLEPLARELYSLACQGSSSMWHEIDNLENLIENPRLRSKMLMLSHQGMMSAQRKMIEIINQKENLSNSLFILIREAADSIAWQLLGYQLCYARRLFKNQKQPNLKQSNLDSVVLAAENYVKENPGSVALISDLTSFVQVGDILALSPNGSIEIIEVKEGSMNQKISNFLKFQEQYNCEHAEAAFEKKEGDQAMKQLKRVSRQIKRMEHVKEVFTKGESKDPDTLHKVKIPEDKVYLNEWYEIINSLIEESKEKNWAISVIDESLFIGCYKNEPMRSHGHILFNSWFDNYEGSSKSPRTTLFKEIHNPLALPIFNLQIPDEAKFDLLFGRLNICLGLNIESLLNNLEKNRVTIEYASNKELSSVEKLGIKPYKYNGKALTISKDDNKIFFMDGVFLRTFHHLQNPLSIVLSLLDNIDI